MTDGVRTVVKTATNSDMSIIPGGLTGHIQPADLCWNKPFKARYKELYREWTAEGEKSYTRAGNIRAPSKLQCLEWVKKAWAAIEVDVIKRSFKSCGISVKIDGSEDEEIHCTKASGVAAEARAEITKGTAALLAPREAEVESDDPDPFKDIEEDEEELEENEMVIDEDEDDYIEDSDN